jgi:hypothetical protein
MMENIGTGTGSDIVKSEPGNLAVGRIGDPVLAEHAAEIRRRGKRVKEDIQEIGRHLVEAQEHAGHGAWLSWIEAEFGWGDQTAYRFMHLYKAQQMPGFHKLWNSDLPLSSLYQLAAPKTPEEARQIIAERIEAGEQLSCAAVTEVIAQSKDNFTEAETANAGIEAPSASPALESPGQADDDHDDDEHDDNEHDGDDDAVINDLVLLEFFLQASGSDIFDRIPPDRLNEVCRDFLDKLTVAGLLESMSENFGSELRDRVPKNRRNNSKKWKRTRAR